MLRHQNLMLALRVEMGWPRFKLANDCLAFSSGEEMSFQVGMELARVAQLLGKDVIYSGWASTKATKPTSFSLAYREVLTVDVIDKLVPHAVNDTAPLTLVSIRAGEHFVVDRRGSLVRVAGKPRDIGTGRQLAMKRIKARAARMGDTLLASNRFLPTGQDWIEPDAVPAETVVRFG
ncbi:MULTISPECIES: hypothetical protein [unclassified Sphingomonas]|uniref:hypothetical protein n=1 Tax=unclassified Sphingomonas TaxID=196159 RepID=UPI001FB1D66E|nr:MULTISPECIES: hypothetical protein [unclassified Sphingomonas]